MGARPEQSLTLSFLAAVRALWLRSPDGEYEVREEAQDLIPALAQICLKALATDARDAPKDAEPLGWAINGSIIPAPGRRGDVTVRDALNKIIHGEPTSVVVGEGDITLHYRNMDPTVQHPWQTAWFASSDLLLALDKALMRHPGGELRDAQVLSILEGLDMSKLSPQTLDPQRG